MIENELAQKAADAMAAQRVATRELIEWINQEFHTSLPESSYSVTHLWHLHDDGGIVAVIERNGKSATLVVTKSWLTIVDRGEVHTTSRKRR